MERWEPVQQEIKWVLAGCPNKKHHKKILPEYCYNIFALQKRTIYKVHSPLSEVIKFKSKRRAKKAKTVAEAKKAMKIDWEKLGCMFGMGERSRIFWENEAGKHIRKLKLGKKPSKRTTKIMEFLFGETWWKRKLAKMQSGEPAMPVEKVIAEKFVALMETTKKAVPDWHQKAAEWSPDAVTKFHAGVTKGSSEFLDNKGELKGEKKIKLRETYEILLLAWPEIQEMINAKPKKTRNDLWAWLLPFSHARWIEIRDLEQLNRLCTEIKLRLKKPGPPEKAK